MNKPTILVPDRPKPTYVEVCQGKYAFPLPFETCKMRFWNNNSKYYEKSCFLCSLFPSHEFATEENSFFNTVIINTEYDLCKYYSVIYELYLLISGWKYIEFYIGKEICYPSEFWLYVNTTNKYASFTSSRVDVKAELKFFNNKWETEKSLYDIIRNLFIKENVIFHYRAHWLERLELDIYISDLMIGIEYQGIQHYKPLEHWGGEPGFAKRRANDIRKKNLCEQNGIRLIYFYYYEDITEELVMERLLPYIN